MKRLSSLLIVITCAAAAVPAPSLAWGNFGHTVVGEVAWNLLNDKARAAVIALLNQSHDTLTAPDFPHRATWADAQRNATHGATAAWHFVNTPYEPTRTNEADIDQAAQSACHRHSLPGLAAGADAPREECIIAKIEEFERDLADPKAPADERVLALFYIEHLVGDISQPLHAISNYDAGGNCIHVSVGRKTTTLHAYWDDQAVLDGARGYNPIINGDLITKSITKHDVDQFYGGTPVQWAADSYRVAVAHAYNLGTKDLPTCENENVRPIELTEEYRRDAAMTAHDQLVKAGLRLAFLINETLGR